MRIIALAAGAALSLMIEGTATAKSPFESHFEATPPRHLSILPFTEPPEIVGVESYESCLRDMWARGFAPIGRSYFNARQQGDKDLLKFAGQVHARYVCESVQLAGSRQVSISLPTTTTVTGSVGNQPLYAQATSDNGEKKTFTIPFYTYDAVFMAPVERAGIGLIHRPPTPDEIQASGTNAGVMIIAVRRGSPSFVADILPGDVLVSLAGRPIYDGESLNAAYDAAKGKTVDAIVSRRGQRVTRSIQVSAAGDW